MLNTSINRMQLALNALGGARPQPSFDLPFPDDGSGVVSVLANRGGVSATFTRATAATTIGSTGLVVSVSSGVARSYYDPTSLAYLGYLAEGARTNLLLRSEEFNNASWTKGDTTITADNTTSPDGTANADLLTAGTAGTDTVQQSVTATADVNYAFTVFLKFGNNQWTRLRLSSGAQSVNAWFDIQNGVVGTNSAGGTGAHVASRIKAYPNGWYRCELVGSIGSGATAIIAEFFSASSSGGGRVNNATRYAWGAQFENNVSFASSYIPTAGATVTRNADVLTYPSSIMNFGTGEGTWFGQFVLSTADTGRKILIAGTDSGNNRFSIRGNESGQTSVAYGTGSAVVTLQAGAAAADTQYKVAAAYGSGGGSISRNGGAAVTSATASDLGSAVAVGVGADNAGNTPLFGTISRVAYYPRRLPNGMLQQLTM